MKRILAVVLILILGLGQNIYAQTVKGKVVDAESGEPIVGATVYIKGSTMGTITSLDGSFSMQVPAQKEVLQVSFIGYITYSQEIAPKKGETLNLGTIKLKSNAVGLDAVKVVASFAVDRQTPVTVSKIEPAFIDEKLGNQEFPEILKTTPSIYATKQGGGYGDSRVNLRGFDSRNFAVMINGVPVNDMENGYVYWSNWSGLSDFTRTIQVQRGLGASRLAISSVGGTINILTKTTDVKKGGSVYYGIGNNRYNKVAFSLSTGLMDNGWAISASGSHTWGDGYIKGTNFDAYAYFLNVSKKINEHHQLSYTLFGAPQWHNQRSNRHPISFWLENKDGIRANTDYGYRNGDIYGGDHAYNQYHKPMMILNHFWNIDHNTQLNTAFYASFGRGGGRRVDGPDANWLKRQYPGGDPYPETILTPEGYYNYDAVIDSNYNSMTGSRAIIGMSMNEHDWYGMLSSFNKKFDNFNLIAGLDVRYYKGYHYKKIDDLLGGKYYLDAADINRDPGTPLKEGDKYSYYNVGIVFWKGMFLQLEYVTDQFSAFISGTTNHTGYRRIDYFKYVDTNQVSDWKNFLTYSIKGGANYNINDKFNVFINSGYFTRAPFFKYVFLNYTNTINEDIKPEKVFSTDLGIGYSSKNVKANLYAYYTLWKDKSLTRTLGNTVANITGLDALHRGIEGEFHFNPSKKLQVYSTFSLGDWRWKNDVFAAIFDQDQNFLDSLKIYAKDVHVGDAAQTTAALGADWEALPKLKIGFDWTYFDRLYAYFDVENRTDPNDRSDAWEVPAYNLLDLNFKYRFHVGDFRATLYGKVNNVFDTKYIADATDGVNHDALSSYVFFGFGRTWTLGLKVRF